MTGVHLHWRTLHLARYSPFNRRVTLNQFYPVEARPRAAGVAALGLRRAVMTFATLYAALAESVSVT